MSQGREAATLAASSFTAHLFCGTANGWNERLVQAITHVNAEVYRRLRGDGGTTLSAVVSSNDGAMFCHVGDSRIYGVLSDRTLEQLTRDDTINALLKRQEGEAEAAKDSRLLQFVGMGDEMEAQIAAVPGYCRSVLLTSDGAHDVTHSVFQRVVGAAAGGSDLIRKLLMLADMTGGRDNASAILLPIASEAEHFDECSENELLVIMPNDTLAIHLTGSETWERSGFTRNPPRNYPPREPNKRIDEAPIPTDGGNIEPDSKPAATESKGRTSKSRKPKRSQARPKADAAGRLRLDGRDNEVDVQFSTLATQPDDRKQ